MRILTCDEVRQAESEAVSRPGMSASVLMQRAGYAVAQFCVSHFKFNSVCVVCGTGRNGGNGLAAAEALHGIAAKVSVIILAKEASELSSDAAAMSSRLTIEPIWSESDAKFETAAVQEALRAELILDAIADAGASPPLPGVALRAVQAINDAFGIVVSVDTPSGADADTQTPIHQRGDDLVFAHGIITFVAPRPAHVFGDLTSGPIAVNELGVQPVLVPNKTGLNVITSQEVGIAFPRGPDGAHQGQFGHVLVIAGSLGKAGAAGLAGIAALRAGASLVTVACPRSIQATVEGFALELMTEGLPETEDGAVAMEASEKVERLLAGKDVVVLGPGLSRAEETTNFVRRLVARCPLPLVLDADGLNAFAGHTAELAPRGETTPFRVVTLNREEAAWLLGLSTEEIEADRLKIAKRISQETGSCVVLKGWRTVVAGVSGETWINMSGNALAKGGSGDVLSGIIAAALARHSAGIPAKKEAPAPESAHINAAAEDLSSSDRLRTHQEQQLKRNAAQISAYLEDVRSAAAVHLHGLAADFARDQLHENTMLATDLLNHLSEAFRECELQRDRELFYLQK